MADGKRSGGRRAGRRVLPGVFVFLLFLPALCLAQGLKLDTAKEKEADDFDRPNPHFELDCAECHGEKPGESATWATVKFVNGEEGNVKLCYTCHDVSDNIHPIDVDPTKATPPVIVPQDFPLERVGPHKGQVVCSTCHFIHAKTAGLKLLRGFPESALPEDVAKARFKDRRELCKSCHGEKLREKSPHKGKVAADEKAKKTCSFCHAKEPKEGEEVQFTKNPVELCDFCHAATKGGHFLLVNPFADPNLAEQVKASKLPLYKGDYTCVSCHNPHGGTGEEKFIRKEFVALALQSPRVRPHFMKAFCEACHTVRPKFPKGDPNAQKLAEIPLRSADMNELCNRCHESGLSKANAHPILKVAGKYVERIPKDWPLQDGGLTCMTCHTGGDSPTLDPQNPTFLRGAPYETRNTMCWTCHKQAEFRATNPHTDINKGEGCTFCHSTKPNRDRSVDLEAMKFKGDIVLLCIRCHDATPHPANHDHTGVPDPEIVEKNNIKIPKAFPRDRIGRITCATCHNPHAGGEQRGVAVGMEICSSCHNF
jgi:predicted CXXCH cytochrome family protein